MSIFFVSVFSQTMTQMTQQHKIIDIKLKSPPSPYPVWDYLGSVHYYDKQTETNFIWSIHQDGAIKYNMDTQIVEEEHICFEIPRLDEDSICMAQSHLNPFVSKVCMLHAYLHIMNK